VWRWQAALGLGVDELAAVNSTAGSRLWKWSGRAYADDTQHSTLTNDSSVTSQRDGILHCIAAVFTDAVMWILLVLGSGIDVYIHLLRFGSQGLD